MNDLQDFMDHIARVWKCDAHRYPELTKMTLEQRKNFLLKHSLLHINKTTGKIAALCEDFDHNGKLMKEELNLSDLSIKMFINALNLAKEVGLSAKDLLSRGPTFLK